MLNLIRVTSPFIFWGASVNGTRPSPLFFRNGLRFLETRLSPSTLAFVAVFAIAASLKVTYFA
jgi:hypothetical protein